MKLIAVGVGPGDPRLVTYAAVDALSRADLVLVPLSSPGRASVAEAAVRPHLPGLRTFPILFPMVRDAETRDLRLKERLLELKPQWQKASLVALPVIGDSALYATAAYLYDVWRELVPELELELVPGVSAHSLTAAAARCFLAMGDDVLTVIPGTAPGEKIERALAASDAVALYKPVALANLAEVVGRTGPWRRMIRVDRAGLPDQRIFSGVAALNPTREYLSTLLLWR